MTVLIVEDDNMILEGLKFSLNQEGYQVAAVSSVKEAIAVLHGSAKIDICLLDVLLPDGTGYEICQEIRKRGQMPILFLTACDDEVSTVMALEQGADDYISKPFRIRELLARMKAILRRTAGSGAADGDIQSLGHFEVNRKTGKLYSDGVEIPLTAMEYKLLLVFLNHRGQNLSRQQILDCLWDDVGDFVNDNTLSVYIKRLRKKLGDTEDNQLIRTVRGIGYRLEK